MVPALSNPSTISFLGTLSLGTLYVRCLLAVFVIQAIVLAIFLAIRVKRQLRLLDEAEIVRQARAADANAAPHPHPKRDVWTS